MKVTSDTVWRVMGLSFFLAIGFWAAWGHPMTMRAFFAVNAVTWCFVPVIAWAYYLGHKQGYSDRQAEVREAIEKTTRRFGGGG